MEQIISVLTRSGLLRSVRGAQGGYHLAKRPADITVGMILRATEGDLAPAECVSMDGHALSLIHISYGLWAGNRHISL